MGGFLGFGGGPSLAPYQAGENAAAGQVSTAAGNTGGIASTAGNNFTTFNPYAVSATQKYGTALSQDPFTDTYSTTALSNATQGTTAAYQSAKAALSTDLASRGIGSGASSSLTGGEANIGSAEAGQMSSAAQQLAQLKVEQHLSQLGEAAGLYSGAANTAEGQAVGANQVSGQLASEGANIYSNEYQQALQQQQQQQAGLTSLFSTLGNVGGTLMGAPGAGNVFASLFGGGGGSSAPGSAGYGSGPQATTNAFTDFYNNGAF